MSEEFSDLPQGCSTPVTERSRSRTSSIDISDSQSVRLDNWSLDTEGIRLNSDVLDCTHGSKIAVCSNCWSVTSTVPTSSRPLFSDIDRTLLTISSGSEFSDDDSELNEVFCEAVSQLKLSNETLSTELSIESTSDIEEFELNFEEPREYSLCGEPTDNSRPSTRASVETVVRMAPANKYLKNFRLSIMIWEDEYETLNKATILPNQLQATIDSLSKFMAGLQDVQLHFAETPSPEFGDAELTQSKSLRRQAAALRNDIQQMLFDHDKAESDAARAQAAAANTAAAAAAASANTQTSTNARMAADIAKLTITTMEPTLLSTLADIKQSYVAATGLPSGTPGEYKRMEASCGEIDADCKITIEQFEGLKKEAVAAGDPVAAERFLGNILDLQAAQKAATTKLRSAASDLGLLPGQSNVVAANLNLKAPVFSGAPNDGLDFYTFKKKLSDYFESICAFSHHSMLIKLKAECLSEPAAQAVRNHETYLSAMEELKRLYGQPRILFTNKVKELKKVGKCPDGSNDTRIWAIEMKNQLTHLSDLATTHKIKHMFESSQVIDVIEGALKTRDSYKFRDKLREQTLLDPNFDIEDREQRVTLLKEFLSQVIDEATFDMNYNMSRGHRAAEQVLSGDKTKNAAEKPKDKVTSKKSYANAPAGGCGGCCSRNHAGGSDANDEKSNEKSSSTFNSTPIVTNKSKTPKAIMCKVCEVEHTHLSYCEAYQRAAVHDKFKMLCAVKACTRCLRMDAGFSYDQRKAWYNNHMPFCTDKFLCDIDECASRPSHFKNNVTLCPKHFDQNRDAQDEYMQSLDSDLLKDGAKFYLNMHGMYNGAPRRPKAPEPPAAEGMLTIVEPDVCEPAVYMLQMVPGPKDEKMLVFYDSGCYMAALSDRAYEAFDTTTVRPGPTYLHAAANSTVELAHGDEQLLLQLVSERSDVRRFATITALRMPEISSDFPVWPLAAAWAELQAAYVQENSDGKALPTVENEIGGCGADLMIGISYKRYFPTLEYTLPGGLSIYSAKLRGCDGHQGVIGGPSPLWRNIAQNAFFLGPAAYLVSELRAYRSHCAALKPIMSVNEDETTVNCDMSYVCCEQRAMAAGAPSKFIKDMLLIDEVGAEIDYRCERCRLCYDCKDAERVESISLQEETEQFLIENCVHFDEKAGTTVAKLPFLETAEIKLNDNYFTARKILEGQIRQAHKRQGAVEEIEASHNKLRDKGYVARLDELPEELRMSASAAGYYIPWRTVQSDSLSTPTRMVFDASSKTSSGNSLNCLLAKGRNMLADMLILLHKFRFGVAAFTADVSMAYNSVALHPSHFRYHKYLWVDGLAVGGAVVIMVVLTLIYGVRPAGNLTMQAFKITAEVAEKNEVLKESGGPECLKNNTYMDDVLAAYRNFQLRDNAADGLVQTLDITKMKLKAITKSGEAPSEKVSVDLKTVSVVGYIWDPVTDMMRLDIKPLFFGKKVRGRRPSPVSGDVKDALRSKFTRRELAGKIAAIYDPLGMCVPVTAKMKLCLRDVVKMTSDWDELLPEEKLDEWVSVLNEIQQLGNVEFPRTILDEDCGDDATFELITCTDASQTLAAAAVYLRVIKANGEIKCGLLTAKSKLTSKLTIPRAELKACVIGVCITEVVKRALGPCVTSNIFLTDSVVALTWINTDQRPLQVGVRNAVIQIRRFSQVDQWYHVGSADNLADIGTRGPGVADIMAGSVWQRGHDWMRGERALMPIRKLKDVEVSNDEKVAVNQEVRNSGLQGIVLNLMEERVSERYAASEYLFDPCAMPWPKFVRKIAVVMRAMRCFLARGDAEKLAHLKFVTVGGHAVINLTEEDVKLAERYVFTKATKELCAFNDVDKLVNVRIKDDIAVHTGRLMDGVGPADPLNVMLDVEPLKFVKPVVDRWSPLAYSIMIHAHATLAHHGGAVSTLRSSETIAYITHGKSLAVEVRKHCGFCKRYRAKCEEAVMGPIPAERVTVAPAFYHCQIDLFGPFDSHCKHGRRAVVKVYGLIIKCMTTLAVSIFVMDAYNTASFLDGFYRHSSRFGYPAKVFVDAGTQLIAAFNNGEFSMHDVTQSLNGEHGVQIEFSVCTVNAHEAHGLVERAIREVKRILVTVFGGLKMDILRYETVFSWVANEINSLPVCLGGGYRNLEHLDLITPNRLILGRNNVRAPADLRVDHQPQSVLRQCEEIEQAWWDVWVKERLGELVPRAKKWSAGEPEVRVGDVVVFVKDRNDIMGVTWRIGLVSGTEASADGVVRKVTIKYRVVREDGVVEADYRETKRSVRHVAVVVSEDELDLPGMLSEAQRRASVMMWRKKLAGGPCELRMGRGSGVGVVGDHVRANDQHL